MCKFTKKILNRKLHLLSSIVDLFSATVLRSSYSLELAWFHELLRKNGPNIYGLDDIGRVSYTKTGDHWRRFIGQQRWNSIKDYMKPVPGEVTENSFVITKIGASEYNRKCICRGVFRTLSNNDSANIHFFKVTKEALEEGVKYVQS